MNIKSVLIFTLIHIYCLKQLCAGGDVTHDYWSVPFNNILTGVHHLGELSDELCGIM